MPALDAADAGISVPDAVDVARESADIVLIRPEPEVLRTGVKRGRRTSVNTLKHIAITTSANFGNMVSMARVTSLLPFLPEQILLDDVLSDLPALAIASDRVVPERLEAPQRREVGQIRRCMIVFGLISSAFGLMTFAVLLWLLDATEATFHTAWFTVSLLMERAVLLALRSRRPALRRRPGRAPIWTRLAVFGPALALPFVGPVGALFGFVPLAPLELAAIGAMLIGYVLATEHAKARFFAARPETGGDRR